MDRREFVKRSSLGGVVLVAGGLLDAWPVLAAPKPSTLGYRIGDQAADFAGYDQYMKWRKLSDNRGSWVLIDLCPVWCPPCNVSARWQFTFTQYVRSTGIPFHMQSVVVEGADLGQPSSRDNAEGWASGYELEREAVLHDNGDPNSPLRQLVVQYAQANNNPQPGYPTYVLVDPNGVIRDYILGADLNAVQASLASETGTTLNKDWNDESLLPQYDVDATVGATSFKLWDGMAVSMSGGGHLEDSYGIFNTSGGAISIFLWPKLGDPVTLVNGNPVQDHSKLFDLHSPITMLLGGVAPPPGAYRRVDLLSQLSPPLASAAVFGEYAPGYYTDPASDGWKDQGSGTAGLTVMKNPDGSTQLTFTASDFFADPTRSWGADDDARASNEVVVPYVVSTIRPYRSGLDLSAAVSSDESLSTTTQQTVVSLIQGGLAKLGNRDYAGSANQFAKAQSALQAASSSSADRAGFIKDTIAWLGTHYNN